jgi:hypothetical protein
VQAVTAPIDRISVELNSQFDPPIEREPAVVLRVSVGEDIRWDMLPYPTSRRSVITRDAFRDVSSRMSLPPPS